MPLQRSNQVAQGEDEVKFQAAAASIIEFAETLTGKYGAEEKLIYKFTDRGERELALRYDLTVPLARYIANNLNLITKEPFRRYQTGEVFRGENTQKGRYRQFTQFDFDTVGSDNIKEDAKIIAATIESTRKVRLRNAKMLVNDRRNFEGVPVEAIRIIDKLDKIGIEGVTKELNGKYIDVITDKSKKEILAPLFQILEKEFLFLI